MSVEIDPTSSKKAARDGLGRGIAVWVILVVAGLLLLLTSFAVWVDRVALNTQVFSDTSSELLDDKAIRNAVGTRAIDELFDNVDVQAEVEAQLPKDVKSLSGPATAALRQGSYEIIGRALEQPRLQQLFAISLEESHKTLVEVLEGGGSRVSTQGGEVTLDLRQIIREAAERIGIGEQVADKIPVDAGRIVILRSDQLDTAQDAFQLLNTLAWVLPLLTLVAFGFAVWLAEERRRAVRGIGFTLVVVGVLGLLAARLTRTYLVDSLVAQRDDREAAGNAWNILTDLMRGSFRWMIVVGILFVVAAWLAGPGRRAADRPSVDRAGGSQPRLGLRRACDRRAAPPLLRSGQRLHSLPLRRPRGRTRRNLDRADAETDSGRVPRCKRSRALHGRARAVVGLVG